MKHNWNASKKQSVHGYKLSKIFLEKYIYLESNKRKLQINKIKDYCSLMKFIIQITDCFS